MKEKKRRNKEKKRKYREEIQTVGDVEGEETKRKETNQKLNQLQGLTTFKGKLL